LRLLYVSNGNIPSRWAHTFQVMKMADALSQVSQLELLTAGSLLPSRVNRADLHAWYGVSRGLRIVRLPVYGRVRGDCFRHDQSERFDAAAAWYARWRRPDLVYSRSSGAALRCAASGLPTVVESHAADDPGRVAQLREAAAHPALRCLVTVTEALRQDWLAAGLPAGKIQVWPDAVDLERFADLPEPRAARAALGLPREGALAVYAGHFYHAKGVPDLVDAARRLPCASGRAAARRSASRASSRTIACPAIWRRPMCWCSRTPRASRRRAPPPRSSSSSTWRRGVRSWRPGSRRWRGCCATARTPGW
jgi:glycosyltransferase involved in cell wall biosynthesis